MAARHAQRASGSVPTLELLSGLRRRIRDRWRSDPRVGRLTSAHRRIDDLNLRVEALYREIEVRTVTDWIEHASLTARPLISVVLPTRDRSSLLPRAIESVKGQTYTLWELLIVDDGSVDGTPGLLAGLDDERIRTFRPDGGGVCAARILALDHARGELIVYLDDDNIMHPGWLKAVVWGFEQRPQAVVLYGAFVVDDTARIKRKGKGDFPRMYFFPYDHRAVAKNNIADMGCIAHRAGLDEARFDETLKEMGDWDMFLRLTRNAPPLALPALACFYTTDAPHRLTNGPTHAADARAVRVKN